MSEILHADYFRPYIGKTFRVLGTSFAFPLLEIVSNNWPLPPGVKRRPFLLIFRAMKTHGVLAEGLYDCDIEGGPKASLYIVPIHTAHREWQDYQAVFN